MVISADRLVMAQCMEQVSGSVSTARSLDQIAGSTEMELQQRELASKNTSSYPTARESGNLPRKENEFKEWSIRMFWVSSLYPLHS